MYQRILVPLDGSELAECVLSHVEHIAKGCGVGSVVLVRVIDTFTPSSYHAYISDALRKELEENNEKWAMEYLDEVTGRVDLDGIHVEKQLLKGVPAEEIAKYATDNETDLIVIATHGRSGISRWAWGSIADRILRSACVPVLMIRAPGCVEGI